jgi:Spy/CpxP family protein refolding chaperone
MRKPTTWITALIIAVSIAAVPFAYAQHVRGTPGQDHGFQFLEHLQHVRQQLDLTDDQVAQLKAIGGALKEQNAPFHQQLHAGLHSVATTLLANPNDITTAQSLLDQQNEAERVLKANTLAAASKALNVLTPGQRSKLADMIAKRWAARG